MMKVLFRRLDGTFVAEVNGLPYHVVPSDPLFAEAQIAGADAPLEPPPPTVDLVPEPAVPTPAQMRAALLGVGMTEAQVDGLFRAAMGVKA